VGSAALQVNDRCFDPEWGKDFWSPKGLQNDSFQGNLIFKEFDFHYRMDALGSRQPDHK
jgi:hypothetical protein